MSLVTKTQMHVFLALQPEEQSFHTSCDCLACSSHEAEEPYELNLVLGEEITVLGKMEGTLVKATSQLNQNTGYVPSQCLRKKHQLPLVVGLQDYHSDSELSLSFSAGDNMLVISSDGDERLLGYHTETKSAGYLPRAFIKEKLERKRWYMGNMLHSEADALMKQKPNTEGSFLIHDQFQNIQCLALRGQKSTWHYQIHHSGYVISIENGTKFNTLQDLISHYSQEKGPLCTTLKQPCSSHFGPLQSLAIHNVSEKQVSSSSSFGIMKELDIGGKRCAGVQFCDNILVNEGEQHEMLLQLARVGQQLQRTEHPNIEQFFGVHLSHDCHPVYLVMELMHSTLSGHLEKHGVPDPPTYYNIFSDVALGLHYLHQQSPPIIHRYLSANNVLLSSSLQAKISLSTVLRSSPNQWSQTTKAADSQTACYMPPEAIVESPKYSKTIDSFSFGILMIHTLCGDWPIPDAPESRTCIDPHNAELIIPVSEFDRCKHYIDTIGLNHPLMDLIRKCLSNNPDSRPDMSTVETDIVHIHVSQIGCGKQYYAALAYHGSKECELSVSVGEEVQVYATSHNVIKAFSVAQHQMGYVPCGILRQHNEFPLALALYDYHSDVEDDLSFSKGDIVHILSMKDGDWWYGLSRSSRKQGFIPSNYLSEHRQSYEWYWVNTSHSEADNLLNEIHNTNGSFLIHEESQEMCCLSLKGQDGIMHHQIHKFEGTVCIVRDVTFKTLQDLVYYYSQHAGVLCTKLEQPYSRATNEDEVDRRQVELVHRMSVGECGEVWKGLKDKAHIVVKTLIPKAASSSDFLRQASLIAQLNHPNIIQCHGICTQKEPLYILMEFMKYGNLQEYLSEGEGKEIHSLDLVCMAIQVARGMAYLEQQGYIHCGLAARSILVGDGKICKIANFKRAQKAEVYKLPPKMQVPIKWTAPEVLTIKECTIKSDVWSFGIVLYEILT